MRRIVVAVVPVVAVAWAAGCGGTQEAALCEPSQMKLSYGEAISPATGQNPRSFLLTNMGSKPCLLHGYPTVAVLDKHGRIPFPIYHGGDMMVSARPPKVVRFASHHSVLFVLNKYRCDLGTRRAGTMVRVGLPGLRVSEHLIVTIPFYPTLGYCGNDTTQNLAASRLTVSPVVAALADAMGH
jgi:Domain of unknown function (DUF4232)